MSNNCEWFKVLPVVYLEKFYHREVVQYVLVEQQQPLDQPQSSLSDVSLPHESVIYEQYLFLMNILE